MREPVVEGVGSYPLLVTAIDVHPPDLHGSRANRVEVDQPSVRSELGTVVQPVGRGQAMLGASICGNRINIEVAACAGRNNARVLPSGDQPCQYEGPRRRDLPGRSSHESAACRNGANLDGPPATDH